MDMVGHQDVPAHGDAVFALAAIGEIPKGRVNRVAGEERLASRRADRHEIYRGVVFLEDDGKTWRVAGFLHGASIGCHGTRDNDGSPPGRRLLQRPFLWTSNSDNGMMEA